MGDFDEALGDKSIGSGRVIKKWCQADHGSNGGVCATVVTRWMKYKLAGNDNFWANMKSGAEYNRTKSRLERIALARKWGRIKMNHQHYRDEAKESEPTKAHFGGKYAVERMAGNRKARSGKRLKVSRKLKEKFSCLGYSSSEPKDISLMDEIIGTACELPGRASYVSLSQSFLTPGSGHAVGFFCNESRQISFFDPNMGEVFFEDPIEFKVWFKEKYQPLWDQSEYKFFNKTRGTTIQGLEGMEAAEKTVKWVKELVELVEKEEMIDSSIEDSEDPFADIPSPSPSPVLGRRSPPPVKKMPSRLSRSFGEDDSSFDPDEDPFAESPVLSRKAAPLRQSQVFDDIDDDPFASSEEDPFADSETFKNSVKLDDAFITE